MSYIKKVDHITYACEAGTIEKWAWFHIEVEGGTLINRIDDVRPGDPDSSMKIWCIDFGDFGVALIEGIDRAKKSQVTKFVDRHGDHACQHVAYDTYDLEKFQSHMRELGGSARGGTLGAQRRLRDPQADVRPRLLRRRRRRSHVPRVRAAPIAQRRRRGAHHVRRGDRRGFYDQIEDAVAAGDEDPFFDFSKMPADWEVPAAQPLADR